MDKSMDYKKTYTYEAFISYRHVEPDKSIAKSLLTMLETYRIPTKLAKKLGKDRIGKVFRDREELPVSENLTGDIHTALSNSHFLIVICSKNTPASKYCAKEIAEFKEMHGSSNILTLLIDGEPDNAFPQELRYSTIKLIDELGVEKTFTEDIEPLAADIRAEKLSMMKKKLKRYEILRLLAPILGVSYDTLKDREKERKHQRLQTTISLSIAAASILAFIIGIGLNTIDEKKQEVARLSNLQTANELFQNLTEAESMLSVNYDRESALQSAINVIDGYSSDWGGYDQAQLMAERVLQAAAYVPENSILTKISSENKDLLKTYFQEEDQLTHINAYTELPPSEQQQLDKFEAFLLENASEYNISYLYDCGSVFYSRYLITAGYHVDDETKAVLFIADLHDNLLYSYHVELEMYQDIQQLYLTPDEKELIVISRLGVYETTFSIYDIEKEASESLQWQFTLTGNADLEAVSKDSKRMIVSTEYNSFIFYITNQIGRLLPYMNDPDEIIRFRSDGTYFTDNLRIFSGTNYYMNREINLPEKLIIEQPPYRVETVSHEKDVRLEQVIYRTQDSAELARHEFDHSESITLTALAPNNHWLIAYNPWADSSQNWSIGLTIWNFNTNETINEFAIPYDKPFEAMQLSEDEASLYFVTTDEIVVVDLATESIIKKIPLEEPNLNEGTALGKALFYYLGSYYMDESIVDVKNDRLYCVYFPTAGFNSAANVAGVVYQLSTGKIICKCPKLIFDADQVVASTELEYVLSPEYGIIVTDLTTRTPVGGICLPPLLKMIEDARDYLYPANTLNN
ncbi:MAG: hypothetical protein K0S47_4073 [Herbinix sp.]|jgi:hypothetical protein|nr:hypothetical protein [Herbinix sp.]